MFHHSVASAVVAAAAADTAAPAVDGTTWLPYNGTMLIKETMQCVGIYLQYSWKHGENSMLLL